MECTTIDANQILSNLATNIVEKVTVSAWDKVKKYFKDVKEDSVDIGTAFNEYTNSTKSKNSKIKTLIYRRVPKNIYSFYECVGLSLEDKIIDTNSINNLLLIGNKIIITGTGGIGKSMLMKHLFLNTYKDTEYIPILLELRKLNESDNKDISIYNSIYKVLADNGFKLADEYYKYSLEQGAYIILLDGFDEVNRDKLIKIQEEIKEFSDKFSENIFVISSRPNDCFIGWNDFIETRVMPLSKQQALNLIDKIDFDEFSKRAFYKELEINLYEKYTSFASNPLLLTIMLLTFNSHASIPENLNEFYEEAFTTLFNMHDATKDCYVRDIRTQLGCEDFKAVFAYMCFKSYFKQQFEFLESDLRTRIQEAKDKFTTYSFTVDDFQEDLTLSVCMFVKDGISYRFSHRSFQEYFAAVYTCKLTDYTQRKLLTSWFNESLSVISDEYITMLYNLQPDKVNEIILYPGLNKLKELYTQTGFSLDLLERLFGNIMIKRVRTQKDNQNIKIKYKINFKIRDIYLCNILRLTSKLNHMNCYFSNTIDMTNLLAEFISKTNLKDKNSNIYIIKIDELIEFLKKNKKYELKFLEGVSWIDEQIQFCFTILDQYSRNTISHKKKVASIIDEL